VAVSVSGLLLGRGVERSTGNAYTLSAEQMIHLRGGEMRDVPDHCCKVLDDCKDKFAASCASYDQQNCNDNYEDTVPAGNTKSCIDPFPNAGKNCREMYARRICRVVRICMWRPDLGRCEGYDYAWFFAPGDCWDDC
jgi:hypothetical protein